MLRAVAWLAATSLLVSGCAGRSVPLDLAAAAQKEEDALLKKVQVYEDPRLDEYLSRIGERLGPGFTFRVLRDPTLNAFAMPGGRVYLHTGLLACLDNEAQLAAIVAREMTHASEGHARSRGLPARRDAGAPATVLGPTAGAIFGLGLPLMVMAAVDGYGGALERAADVEGLERLARAGYDPGEAPRAFARLRSELADRGTLETFLLGSASWLAERIESTQAIVATTYAAAPPAVRDTEDFRTRVRAAVRENAAEDVRAGRFALARRQLERVLAATPDDPIAHTYDGDLHRLQAQRTLDAADRQALTARALAAYAKAVALDPGAAEPHRQLGFFYYEQKDTAKAKAAFEKYLALAPGAPDARRIREYLAELSR